MLHSYIPFTNWMYDNKGLRRLAE